ncbi:amidohydrolase family protein [Candidatus Kaiserbacteria bacterium]|nr:amidohydrolase family protein [Candidatus Kaiserbacteria bacterium]
MKWTALGVVLFALLVGVGGYVAISNGTNVADERIARALAPSECPEAPAGPDFGTMYKGPLIDAHIHIPNPPEGPVVLDYIPQSRPTLGNNITIADFVCIFKQEGIIRAFAFFPVFPGFETIQLAIVKGTMERYGDIFVPFIMPPDRDDRPDGFPTVEAVVLEEMLAVHPGLFMGYGEIGLYERGDHGGPTGSPALPPDSARLREIYPIVRENDLLVYFHLGRGQQEAFERTAAANPDIKFIFHGDQLIVYDERGQNLKAVDEILSRHPNVYYGVDELYGDVWLLHPDKSREEFFEHFENYEALLEKDLATWKSFIERHPNQVLWGTDRGVVINWAMEPEVGQTLANYTRAFIARLPPAVQDKYAYKNAERLLTGR